MTRQFTSIVLLLVPVLVLNALRFVVTPLGEMMKISLNLDLILHAIAILIGVVLYRRTRIVRDHEWQRTRAVKSVGNHFKAEAKGVWEKDIPMDSHLSVEAEANLKGQVKHMAPGGTTEQTEVDTEVEVEMLIDAEHVMRAQNRLSGDDQFGEGKVKATVGAVRKSSPMDTLLDWIGGLFGRDTAVERENKRTAALMMRSSEAPVIAQRPIAPMQPIRAEHKDAPLEITTMSDEGGETEVVPVVAPLEPPKAPSIEEMAYGLPASSGNDSSVSSGKICPSCGASNDPNNRFCDNCGSNI